MPLDFSKYTIIFDKEISQAAWLWNLDLGQLPSDYWSGPILSFFMLVDWLGF
jgi:hypothetical protein